jgi:formylglycine-generating enzyme
MGCSPEQALPDPRCFHNDTPAHTVAIKTGFWIGQTEVTQAAWKRIKGTNPSHFEGDYLPVESVSWYDASSYCQEVGGRLPSEPEWEYAARGGTGGARYGEVDEVAWYNKNSGAKTHAVGGKKPNRFGLYDTLGNVFEWTDDWFSPYPGNKIFFDPIGPQTRKVVRGGSFDWWARDSKAATRGMLEPDLAYKHIGFRCVIDRM